MNDKFVSNYIKNDDSSIKNDESDYEKLINRLKEISSNIALLKKKYLDNL